MGEKKTKNEVEKKQKGNKKSDGDGGKKDDGSLTVVLKVDMHCEGCATKIKRCIRGIKGVESVRGGDVDSNKLTVIGKVDPVALREMVEKKAKKKVELISPSPNKENDNNGNKDKGKDKDAGGGGEKKTGEKPEKKPDDKKPKEPPITTAVMKMNLHCEGCIQKIRKTVTKTKGYQDMSIDGQKNLVTVKGAMDMNALAKSLSEKIKKPVEIVPPKKEGGGGGGGSEKKEKGGGGEKKEKGGDKGEPAVGGGGGNVGIQAAENRVQYLQYGYPNPYVYGYELGYYPIQHFHAPQMFSDENPNACSIM
ncbi:heavy metal-associated isoprenylated plant protein 3 [Diospyros lotus]|uniref:heavy metal-associated isoprenylated plant protein 3 n=1 Tax=Diospyros lotus TaxID=55363 RepID=UPI002254217F|nr:heavy metal-associated isoprenylated plant protein 3 [Diospyros lotus]